MTSDSHFKSRLWSGGRLLAGTLAVVAVLVAWWLGGSRGGRPMYHGQPVRSLLASWQQLPPGANTAWRMKFDSSLSADAVPILIEAMSRTDSRSDLQAMRLWSRLPSWLQGRLPSPVPAEDIRAVAVRALASAMSNSSPARPINRAVANGYLQVPPAYRLEVLRAFSSDPSAGAEVEPILLGALASTNALERIAAAEAMLGIGAGPTNRMQALVASLTPLSSSPANFPFAWPGICRELGRLGPNAAGAMPMLRALAENSLPEVRAEASLACWRIEPAGESAGEFLNRQLGRLGSRGIFVLLAAWSDEAAALKIPAEQALPILSRVIAKGTQAGRSRGTHPPAESVVYLTADQYTPRRIQYPAGYPDLLARHLGCDLAASYGPAAKPIEPILRLATEHPEPGVRNAALNALAAIDATTLKR